MVDAGDARPRQVGVLIALDDLDQTADVSGPDPHPDREASTEPVLLVPPLQARDAVPEPVVFAGFETSSQIRSGGASIVMSRSTRISPAPAASAPRPGR